MSTAMSTDSTSPFVQIAAGAAAGAAGDVVADWQGLAQVPQLLNNVKTGVLTLRSLVHAPQAAMASGNPMVGGAIVALGAQLAVFLYQTAQAIEDDISAVKQVADNYRAQEDRVVHGAHQAMADLDRCSTALVPQLSR
jgi:hypothetical protein